MLHDIRDRLLFSAFGHAHVPVDEEQHMFGELLSKMNGMSYGDKNVAFDE